MPLITAVKCDKCGFAETFAGHIAKYKFVPLLLEKGWCISDTKTKGRIEAERTYCPDCKKIRLAEMAEENLSLNKKEGK